MSENMLLDLRLRRALALSREELPWPVLAEIRVKGMGCSVKERIRKGIEVSSSIPHFMLSIIVFRLDM